ncbi:Relaxase/Mobilization nuclease domain-containing protein [Pyronema omphalodes]|nr:Relaxase/Mobilization nuclease domain-containing protein [Pyronema omphalodes]
MRFLLALICKAFLVMRLFVGPAIQDIWENQDLHLFESAIDLLSYCTMERLSGADWNQAHLLSLAGIYKASLGKVQAASPAALTQYLKARPEINRLLLHLDNDEPGRAAASAIKRLLSSQLSISDEPPRYGKDKGVVLLRKRDIRIVVRLNEKENKRLVTQVQNTALSREAYIRMLINGYVPKELPPLDYYTVMRELHAIGNNLNQLAAKANATGHFDRLVFQQEADRLRESVQRGVALATTAIWDVTDRLKRVIDYVANPEKTILPQTVENGLQQALNYVQDGSKTERQLYVSGINCDPLTAYEQMQRTKRQFQKTDGIMAFHGYQAFAPGETIPEIAHAIGVKLAQELWGERFEVVVSTHLDKQHLHNHFVLNAVSFLDGKRYYDNKASYALLRKTSDRLCREHMLSVIVQPERGKAAHYGEWKAELEKRPTWRGLIREEVDQAIAASMTMTQFFAELRKKGYEVKTTVKHLAIRPPGKERFVRLRSLGDYYTEEALKQRILQNRMPKQAASLSPVRRRRGIIHHGRTAGSRKLKGLQGLYVNKNALRKENLHKGAARALLGRSEGADGGINKQAAGNLSSASPL